MFVRRLTSAEFSSSHDSKRHQAEDASKDQEAEGAHEQAGFLETFEEGEFFVALDFDIEERGEDEDEGSRSRGALKLPKSINQLYMVISYQQSRKFHEYQAH